jgi:SAM-dependent methyltransferase
MMSKFMGTPEAVIETIPGGQLDVARMPGHWLLARLGKRVLRPGGLELTQRMLKALDIGPGDAVVELAPGLGMTARLVLAREPFSYTGVERDEAAAAQISRLLQDKQGGGERRCIVGRAEATGLPDASASVVFGEAMLTMQTQAQKTRIAHEAWRVLKPGGRYGIHEMCLVPDGLEEEVKADIQRDLSAAIHVGARPLTISEWRAILQAEGFQVRIEAGAPMRLLEPQRLLRDEGIGRAIRFLFNALRDGVARKRVLEMRRIFRQYQEHLGAISIVAIKPEV